MVVRMGLDSSERSVISEWLARVHERFAGVHAGTVADYIPELANANPDHFGIALATVDGRVYAVGDAEAEFTIQSISKPFVYGMALDAHGVDAVMKKVGVEPSGDSFNSIVMDEHNNRPMNPMVNAGAIAAAALVPGDGFDARFRQVLGMFSTCAGRPLEVDERVFESERATGNRNRAIAFLELSSGMIDEPVHEHLDLYFRQCAISVSARDLAMMGATLANGGRHPLTGDRALGRDATTRVLSVMATCGIYDWSGEWMYRVGLPAKSGVGGGILAVLPGQLALATFSPPLDAVGNSHRGVLACEALGNELLLHLFNSVPAAASTVRRQYTASSVSSKRLRGADDRARLVVEGDAIQVFELQGDLNFARTERLLREIEPVLGRACFVIIDYRRVGRDDPTTRALLSRLAERADAEGTQLLSAGANEKVASELVAGGWSPTRLEVDVDHALEVAEDHVLQRAEGRVFEENEQMLELTEVDILRDLAPEDVELVRPIIEARTYESGDHIIRRGDAADRLFFLASGKAIVVLPLEGERRMRRLRTYDRGVSFGESALFDGTTRTADVIADGPVRCYELPIPALSAVGATHPRVQTALLAGVGRNIAALLAKATDELRALDP